MGGCVAVSRRVESLPNYVLRKLWCSSYEGANIVLGTPGRLIDHLEKSESLKSLGSLEFLVLDEADRMLEMGYFEKIKQVISICSERCADRKLQKILLSATLRFVSSD